MKKNSHVELVEKILFLKEKKSALILAHNYQRNEIQDIADFVGDSLGLSQEAEKFSGRIIVFCGVRFMAETAKILSPDKMVLFPRIEAGCPMADMITKEQLMEIKAKHPRAKVVSYVNTTAEVKAESDVCCTSSNALKVVQNVNAKKIIFVPDRNLASCVSGFTSKEIIPYNGYCYVHDGICVEDIEKIKQIHPDAVVFVHPECRPEVIELADEVTSTGGMIKLVRKSKAEKFIIGTEEGLMHRLKKENPGKKFFPAGRVLRCHNMKLTSLEDVHLSLKEERCKIEIEPQIQKKAKKALDKMLNFGSTDY